MTAITTNTIETSNTVTENSFRDLLGIGGYFTAEEVGMVLRADPRCAFAGLVEVLARQTEDERAGGGTCHKNRFGFSKKHVTPGTALAKKFIAGEELTTADMELACSIAFAYRNQLWMVALGAVPINNLDLSRGNR